MRSSKTTLPLEDSWGIVNTSDSANSDQDDAYEEDLFERRMKAQRKIISSPRTEQELEFIMPSLGSNAMDGSRLQESPRPVNNTPRNGESPRELRSRRRTPRPASAAESPRQRSERTFDRQSIQETSRQKPPPNDPSINAATIFNWFLDIIGGAFKALRYPITYALALWLFIGLLMLAQNFFMYSIEKAMSPLCRIPVLSMLNPSCPALHSESKDGIPVAFDKAVAAQLNFEELMEQATTQGNMQLPREMKAGERLIRDLFQLVAYSEINSKNELMNELDRYIHISMQTTEGLTKFNGHIGHAVDAILAMSKYTLRVLDGFQIEQESRGAISHFWEGFLAPFQPIRFTEDLLFDQFIGYTKTIEDEISKLLVEAEDLQMQLNLMESSTDIIGGIAYRDEKHATAKKDEIYSWLWTRLGGNRERIGKVNGQINFLQKVALDRKSAARHLSTTILRLLDTKSQLENLRSRLGLPDLVRETLPLSVHIEIILAGTERLEDKRRDARERELAFILSPKDKDANPRPEIGASRSR